MKCLTTRTPLGLLDEMDRFFYRFHGANPDQIGFDVDVAETKNSYVITGNLPGFAADNVDVRVEGNLLIIEAKILEDVEKKSEDSTWHYRERRVGNMKRSFLLPERVDKNRVEAVVKNGVISLTLNKSTDPSQSITVKSE